MFFPTNSLISAVISSVVFFILPPYPAAYHRLCRFSLRQTRGPSGAANRSLQWTKEAEWLPDRDSNFLGNDRWVERIVLGIAQNQLKCMLSRCQFNPRLGLTGAEMKMRLV